jgi:tetrahydromethanopterin S-methyltransferase subunit E
MAAISLLLGTALAGLLAFLAGIFEDSESNAGSASNPNSQVQLAPQIGNRHRYFNKAISGEPPANALWATTAATTAYLLTGHFGGDAFAVLVASIIGAAASTLLLCAYGLLSHISRIASMKNFEQTLYWDSLLTPLPLDAAFGFLTALMLTLLAFAAHGLLGNPFSVPLIAFFFGITIGAIGSSTYIFGSGIPISVQGDIDVKGEYGYRNSVDTPYFTMRFGGLVTGLAFGMLIFLDAWSRLFTFAGVWTGVIVVSVLVLIILIFIYLLEVYTRKRYGRYTED